MANNITLYNKYRPRLLDEIVGQDHIKKTIRNTVESGKELAHAFLLTGPQGTGKTTLARILSCVVNSDPYTVDYDLSQDVFQDIIKGAFPDIEEIDAASNSSIDDVRKIRMSARQAPMIGRRRVFIIDECHVWRRDAANALLKILEEPPSSTMFILATTEPEKIIPTIKSRCVRFDFRRIKLADMTKYLKVICDREEVTSISDSSLGMIARSAGGKMRDALSTLQSVLDRCGKEVSDDDVADILGMSKMESLLELMESILNCDYQKSIYCAKRAIIDGSEPTTIFQGLLKYTDDIMVAKCMGKYNHLYIDSSYEDRWKKQMENTPVSVFSFIIDKINHYTSGINYNPNPEASLDACIVDIVTALKLNKQKREK